MTMEHGDDDRGRDNTEYIDTHSSQLDLNFNLGKAALRLTLRDAERTG